MKTIVSLIVCLVFLIATTANALDFFEPKNINDLKKTSVKIMNLDQNSGGTGSIYRSFRTGSHILTNKHVCRLIEQGGYVVQNKQKFIISHYKKFPQHDLCLVRIPIDLIINLKISRVLPSTSNTTFVSGHPSLLPHIASKGHFSEHMDIKLLVAVRECTPEEQAKEVFKCMWYGGMPIIKTLDSQITSNLVLPGSSGSAVFNKKGHISGVVFAGSGGDGFSYAFIVPHLYVIYFIQNARRFEWVKVGTKVSDEGVSQRLFDFKKCEKDFCKSIKYPLIWRK